MHSRIFCLIDKNKEETTKEVERENFEDITEDSVYEQFCSVADYCNSDTDLEQDWNWLISFDFCTGYKENDKFYIKFDIEQIRTYLEKNIQELKKIVDNISIDTFKHFDCYELERLINDKYSFYFLDGDQYNSYTLDEFICTLWECNRDKTFSHSLEYEVIRSFDYHY